MFYLPRFNIYCYSLTANSITSAGDCWRHIGEVSCDWPSFVFVVKANLAESKLMKIMQLIALIRKQCIQFKATRSKSIALLNSEYQISFSQAEVLLDKIEYVVKPEFNAEALSRIVAALYNCAAIDMTTSLPMSLVPSILIHPCCELVDSYLQPPSQTFASLLPFTPSIGFDSVGDSFVLPPPAALSRPTSVD